MKQPVDELVAGLCVLTDRQEFVAVQFLRCKSITKVGTGHVRRWGVN
jgi:hypothetical protein